MKARHKKASGGRIYYDGADSNVAKEAKQDRQPLKRGGAVKDVGKMMGEKGKKRMDRRASGGRIGADTSPMAPGSATRPFTTAAKTK